MQFRIRGGNQLIKVLSSVVYDLPAPVNLSYFWNFGIILGSLLAMQILRFCIMCVVVFGFFFCSALANGASFFFFFCIFILVVVFIINRFL